MVSNLTVMGEIWKIAMDPGHGGKDSGADVHGLAEEDFNLIIASMVSAQLIEYGHTVIQTRAFDRTKTLSQRTTLANDTACDLFISIHANAAESTKAEGMEVFFISSDGANLAAAVLESMINKFPGRVSRGIKERDFYVLRKTIMPAILIECGFITNPKSRDFLKDEQKQVAMASAISEGIQRYIAENT